MHRPPHTDPCEILTALAILLVALLLLLAGLLEPQDEVRPTWSGVPGPAMGPTMAVRRTGE